jgi:hypothetical protein
MSPIEWIALGMVASVPAYLLVRAVGRGLIWAFIHIGSPE